MKSLLIGDNAFIGVSHLSQVKARENLLNLDTDSVVRVIDKAVSCGATGFTFTTHSANFEVLRTLLAPGRSDQRLEIYPVLPYAAGYVRTLNEKGTVGLVQEFLSQLTAVDKLRFIVQGGASTFAFDPIKLLETYVDYELSKIPRGADIRCVFLHDVVTDLGLSFRTADMFQSFVRHIRDKWHATPGFVTRNFSRFNEFLKEDRSAYGDITVMTPFNALGFQMNPSKEACESSLSKVEDMRVFAMSILAGGYLDLNEAISYIKTLQNLSGVVIGVSTTDHAEKTFIKLQELM